VGEAAASAFTALASTVEKKVLKDEKVPVVDDEEVEDTKLPTIDPTSVLHSFRPPEESDEEEFDVMARRVEGTRKSTRSKTAATRFGFQLSTDKIELSSDNDE
jgi:hypothetical protein